MEIVSKRLRFKIEPEVMNEPNQMTSVNIGRKNGNQNSFVAVEVARKFYKRRATVFFGVSLYSETRFPYVENVIDSLGQSRE